MSDVRGLLQRAEKVAHEHLRRTRPVPTCLVLVVFDDDDPIEVDHYAHEVRARFARVCTFPVVVILQEGRRPSTLRGPWHQPRWWLEHVPTVTELSDLRPD